MPYDGDLATALTLDAENLRAMSYYYARRGLRDLARALAAAAAAAEAARAERR